MRPNFKYVWLVLIWFIAITAAPVPVNGEESTGRDSFRISVLSPTYGLFRPGAPVTTVITIVNPDSRFTGVIEAWTGKYRTASTVRQHINIGQGKFRFFLYPKPADAYEDELFVRVADGRGKVRTEQSIPLRRKEGRWWIGALCGRGRHFTRDNVPGIKSMVLGMRSTALLPDEWYGYKLFDVLFWDGHTEGDLRPLQRSALAEWIQNGGRLILMAKEGDKDLASPIPEVVPDMTLISDINAEGASTRRVLFSAGQFPAPKGVRFAEKKYGMGSIVLLRTDFAELSSWSRKDIVGLLGYPFSRSNPQRMGREMYEDEWALKANLARSAGYTELSFKPVLIMVLIYLVLVSIVDYLVLKKLKKLPWTWATFPALIGVFSIFSFLAFYQGKLGEHERHELLFHDIGHDGRGRMQAMSCMRKSSTRPIVFDIEASHFLSVLGGPETYERMYGYRYRRNRRGDSGKTRILESNVSSSAKRITIPGYVGSFQFFTEEWPNQSTEVPFACKLRADGRHLAGKITKKIPVPVSHVFLIYKNRIYDIDDSMRISRRSTPIGDIKTPSRYHYYSHRLATGEFNLLKAIAEWTKISTVNFIMCSNAYYMREESAPYPVRDSIYTHFLRDDEAILFAFSREKSEYAGMRVNRVKCIRQIINVDSAERDAGLQNRPTEKPKNRRVL